jgi:hypothetical protein
MGESYASVLLLGLLSHDQDIRTRFRSIAFISGTAMEGAVVGLVYDCAAQAAV